MIWLLLFLFAPVLFADQFDTTFRAGLVALNQNNLTAARSHLEAASQIQPRNSQVWLALAQTYWKLQDLPAARSAAANAEKFSGDAVVLHGLAVFYSETADDGKAVDLLRAAIRRSPFTESYYFDLAQLYLKRQDFAAALDILNSGRKNFDKSAQLELASGVAYYGLRRFTEAIDAFLGTIRLDPGAEQPYVFLGRMLDQAEDRLPKIVEVFAAFARSAPENYLSGFLYAKSLMVQHPDQAEALLLKSIARNGQFWESHFELGVLLDQRQKFEDAAREMRRSIELSPNDPVPHYRLARLYDRLGKTVEAHAERELHARLAGGIK